MKSKKIDLTNQKPGGKGSEIPTSDVEPPDDKPTPPPSFNYIKLFRYATKFDIFLLCLGMISTMTTSSLQPLNNLFFGDLTGSIIKYALATQIETGAALDAATQTFLDDVKYFAIAIAIVGAVMFSLSYVASETFNYTALKQVYKIRSLYLEKALNQDITYFDTYPTGDFASKMSDDLTKLEEGIGEKVPMFVNFISTFIASLVMALVKGWELALICLISLPVAMSCISIISVLSTKLAKNEIDAYSSAASIASEVLGTIRTVLAFGGQQKEINRYDGNLETARKNNIRRALFSGIGFGLLFFCIYGSYALAFWYGVGLILDEKNEANPTYTPANMITVFFSVMTGTMTFGLSSTYIEAFAQAKAAATKIFGVIDNAPIINNSKHKGKQLNNVKGVITFKNVHFHYPSRKDVPILLGLDVEINSGQTVALVGSSGCGKSTCIQLLQRFYDPLMGQVLIDGEDIKEFDLTWLRSKIGVVGQEPVLFGTTIAENIQYGNPKATKEEIIVAAEKANAHEFIKTLPNGYETLVGERGAQLSGGQKQRIAIARALVRDPAILLLDEATSALDNNSEAKVQAALENASKERTTIVVAHRLSTIRNADKIVVLSKGKTVEQGTHDELMALKSEYYKLVTNQITDIGDDGDEGKKVVAVENTRHISFSEDEIKVSQESENITEEILEGSVWSILRMNSPEWLQISIAIIAAIAIGCSSPIFAILFGDILGVLGSSDDNYVRSETNRYCIYFIAAGAVVGVSYFSQIYFFSDAGEKLTKRVRSQMFQAMLRQEIGWYDRKENGVGALCAKLSGEAALIQGATGQRIGAILQAISTIVLAIGLAMFYEWRLGLVTLAFTPVILLATFFQQRLAQSENQGQHKSLEDSTKLAVEAVGNIRTVASLGCEETFHKQYMSALTPNFRLKLRNSHFRALVYGLARSVIFFAYGACMYYGGNLIRDGLDYSVVFKVAQALIMGTTSIANALAFSPNMQKGIQAAAKALKLFNRVPQIRDNPTAIDNKWEKGNIEYSQIHFSYPTRPGTTVLNGLDLSIFQGKTVALVGPSGCGKSTIIQLIERFYDPSSGEVSVDKEDVRNVTLSSLRSRLGIVSQEPNLFDRTIGENIAYGDNTRAVSQEEIIEAAKNANIHNFVASLPLGYTTRLGEKGTQLSGGQKQRIAIARALVRNPQVLLLDEATSALDTESEKVVQEALDKAKQGRTCITIAHRLTTIQDADVICVINKGKIKELGTHKELLQEKGLYYRLYTQSS